MSEHVQTGNMLDVVIENGQLFLAQRNKPDTFWIPLPSPEGLRDVLTREINRLKGESEPTCNCISKVEALRDKYQRLSESSADTHDYNSNKREAANEIIAQLKGEQSDVE